MNVGEIIQRARIILQEPTTDFYTREELLQWLNDGQLQFCSQSLILKDRMEINSVKGQQEYNLPSQFLKSEYISYNNKKLYNIDYYEANLNYENWENIEEGEPKYYYFLNSKIGLIPKPNASNKVIRIYGMKKPVSLVSDTDTPEIPEEYHDALLNFVLYKAKLKDSSPQEAISYLTLFNNIVTLARITERRKDRRDKLYSFYPAIILGR